MSITSYDTDHKFHKHEMDIKKKESIIQEIIDESFEEAQKKNQEGIINK